MCFVISWRPKWCNHPIMQLYRHLIICKKRSRKQTQLSNNVKKNSPGAQVGNSKLESPRSWMCFLPVVTEQVRQSKDFIRQTWKRKSFMLKLEKESGKKYLSGSLWRQEIETPCCEDLQENRERSKLNQDYGKVHCTVTLPTRRK